MARINHTRYDRKAQHESDDWEDKRSGEAALFYLVVLFCIGAFYILDGIADWVVGL